MHTGFLSAHHQARQDLTDETTRRSAPERLRFASPALPEPHRAVSDAQADKTAAKPAARPIGAGLLERFRRRPHFGPAM